MVEKHIQIINKLKVAGLQFNLKEEELLSNIFENKSFLFTGSLTKFTRDEAQVIVEKNGGKIKILSFVDNISTTEIINKIINIYSK